MNTNNGQVPKGTPGSTDVDQSHQAGDTSQQPVVGKDTVLVAGANDGQVPNGTPGQEAQALTGKQKPDSSTQHDPSDFVWNPKPVETDSNTRENVSQDATVGQGGQSSDLPYAGQEVKTAKYADFPETVRTSIPEGLPSPGKGTSSLLDGLPSLEKPTSFEDPFKDLSQRRQESFEGSRGSFGKTSAPPSKSSRSFDSGGNEGDDVSFGKKPKASSVAWTGLVLSIVAVLCTALAFSFTSANKADRSEVAGFATDLGKAKDEATNASKLAADAFDKAKDATNAIVAVDKKVTDLDTKVNANALLQDKRNAAQDRVLSRLRAIQADKGKPSPLAALLANTKPVVAVASPAANASSAPKKAKVKKQKAGAKPALDLSKTANVTPVQKEGLTIIRLNNDVMCIFGKKGDKPGQQKHVFRKLEAECAIWEDDIKTGKVK